jgi:hypothetical protein
MRNYTIPPPNITGTIGLAAKKYYFSPDPYDEPDFVSMLGTPVYSNFVLLPAGDIQDALRIDTVIMTVDQTKNIVKTPIQGRNGTVKEYISDGDFMVSIQGVLISPYPLVFPKEDIDLFVKYCKLNEQLPVASFFLELFGITDIVIEHYKVGEKLGSRNEVPFQIDALSDKAIEFELNPNRGL